MWLHPRKCFLGQGSTKACTIMSNKERKGCATAWLPVCRGEAKQYGHFARAFGIFTTKLSTVFPHSTATVLLAVQATVFENIYEHVNKLSREISKYFISNHSNGR